MEVLRLSGELEHMLPALESKDQVIETLKKRNALLDGQKKEFEEKSVQLLEARKEISRIQNDLRSRDREAARLREELEETERDKERLRKESEFNRKALRDKEA